MIHVSWDPVLILRFHDETQESCGNCCKSPEDIIQELEEGIASGELSEDDANTIIQDLFKVSK